MTPDDLIRIETAIAVGRPLPDDLGRELLKAISDFKTGRCRTLCKALGLRRTGVSSMATVERLAKRNELIRELAKHHNAPTPRQIAREMMRCVRRFPNIEPELKPLYRMLLDLGNTPRSAQQLYNIIK